MKKVRKEGRREGSWVWWSMLLIPEIQRQKQLDLIDTEASLVSIANSRMGATGRPCFKKLTNQKRWGRKEEEEKGKQGSSKEDTLMKYI